MFHRTAGLLAPCTCDSLELCDVCPACDSRLRAAWYKAGCPKVEETDWTRAHKEAAAAQYDKLQQAGIVPLRERCCACHYCGGPSDGDMCRDCWEAEYAEELGRIRQLEGLLAGTVIRPDLMPAHLVKSHAAMKAAWARELIRLKELLYGPMPV